MTSPHTGKSLSVRETPIPGFKVVDLPVHGDARGWFKENWQREKMISLGLDDFGPVQNNISFNASRGVTRGIHAEPWDKYISVATGRVFGAWVDLREGDSFGATYWCEIDPSVAVFVPRGVGNAFQALEDDTAYTYLVNDHWSTYSQGRYTFLNLADESAAIPWPLPLEKAELSAKDVAHPRIGAVTPVKQRKTLVLGASGQLGLALRGLWGNRSDVEVAGRDVVDLSRPESLRALDWSGYTTVINAAAFTAVDDAETASGRVSAWAANAAGPALLARIASEHRLTLVHVSSDYVFDGSQPLHYEDEPVSPLGVYGQSKAAGDHAVSTTPKHYILRTSWVIGEGKNFVRTMANLAERGVSPAVVEDQFGRLSFASEIARAIAHLLDEAAPYGTYNITNAGDITSWSDLARRVYAITGNNPDAVKPVTTEEFFADKKGSAPRPKHSALDLGKIQATGFYPSDQFEMLQWYLKPASR